MSKLLEIISKNGDGAFKHYLEEFHDEDKSKFAVIKISGECFEKHYDTIMEDLKCLTEQDLYPVVILGWGSMLNKKLKANGIEPNFSLGNRVTDTKTLECILDVQAEISAKLNGHSFQVPLVDLTGDQIFEAKYYCSHLGYVGDVTKVNLDLIKKACDSKKIPFIVPIGYKGKQPLNINADTAANFLMQNLLSKKYIALTETGGILDSNGEVIPKISLVDDYHDLANKVVKGGMQKKLEEAKKLLESMGPSHSVQITSPKNLLQELFTHQGNGTKIVQGYSILHSKGIPISYYNKIKSLIETSFEKNLLPGSLDVIYDHVLVEENLDGVALLRKFDGYVYLDKLAVAPELKGAGLGSKLLESAIKVAEDQGGLCWRSSSKWYIPQVLKYGGGFHKGKDWNVYWIGVDPSKIQDIIDHGDNKPPSFR